MNSNQAQRANDLLNYLCKFINNKPVGFGKIMKDLGISAEEFEALVYKLMQAHPDWYTIYKKSFGRQAFMLNATALKDVHKFLVLGGYLNPENYSGKTSVAPAAGSETKEAGPEDKSGGRNTVIIKPRLDLHS